MATNEHRLLRAGITAKVVSERMGQSMLGITPELYSHVLPEMQEKAAGVEAALPEVIEQRPTKLA